MKSDCKDKIRFKSKDEAESRAEFETSKHGILARAYICPDCLHYHLTTKPEAESRSGRMERIWNFKA